jgi:hypothetical protein
VQDLAIALIEFNEALIVQHQERFIEAVLFSLLLKPPVLVFRCNQVIIFFPEGTVCFFTIDVPDEMNAGNRMKKIQVQGFAFQEPIPEYGIGGNGSLVL